jgi:hypothetical protein
MNSQIKLLNPRRERRIPARFSWLDQRLVREQHLASLSVDAQALYLFLACVSDASGMSYYSNSGIAKHLTMESINTARQELIKASLLAYQAPLYQLLSLEKPAAQKGGKIQNNLSREDFLASLKTLTQRGACS